MPDSKSVLQNLIYIIGTRLLLFHVLVYDKFKPLDCSQMRVGIKSSCMHECSSDPKFRLDISDCMPRQTNPACTRSSRRFGDSGREYSAEGTADHSSSQRNLRPVYTTKYDVDVVSLIQKVAYLCLAKTHKNITIYYFIFKHIYYY